MGQYGNHARWEFCLIRWRISRAFLVVEEHVHVLDAVLEHPTAPLDLVEKELLLQTARYLQRDGTFVCRIALVHEELRDDARLERRLGRARGTGRQGRRGQVKKNGHTTISLPVNARE